MPCANLHAQAAQTVPQAALQAVHSSFSLRRRWRLPAAALALVVVLAAAACGGAQGGSASGAANPVQLTVFAAASLTSAFTKLGADFSAAHPDVKVSFNFAGSQELAAQIQEGGPADIFASADSTNMERVASLVSTPKMFVGNQLEIAVAPGNPLHLAGLAGLARRGVKVVLCAPEVPAGKYAVQALSAAGVSVKPVSLEADVKAAVSKVALGEADACVVYRTDVIAAKGQVEGVEIPASQNVTAAYPIAVVKDSKHLAQARAFVDYVLSSAGQNTLRSFGFLPPPE
jgi:molybdate transport system substrate-binding protein